MKELFKLFKKRFFFFFIIGYVLKFEFKFLLNSFVEGIKKFYIIKFKGFDILKMVVVIFFFEGIK